MQIPLDDTLLASGVVLEALGHLLSTVNWSGPNANMRWTTLK